MIKDDRKKCSKVITLDKISKISKKTNQLQKFWLFRHNDHHVYYTLTMTELGTKVITITAEYIEGIKGLFGGFGKNKKLEVP